MKTCVREEKENLASPDKETIRQIFDSIAFRYDFINSLLSLRLDDLWRRKAVRLILAGQQETKTLLDLGVGTGKFLKEFLRVKSWQRAAGVDFSGEMLARARHLLPEDCELVQADIHDLPFESTSFDLVVSSFTERSIQDRPHFFREVFRILVPEGRVAFLYLTRPASPIVHALYAPYLKFYLPLAGRIFSADPKAYRFLSQSIQAFPLPPEIAGELEDAGFQNPAIFPFTFGLSTLLIAQR